MRNVEIGKIGSEALQVELARHARHCKERLQLARERQLKIAALRQRVIERFHAEPVASKQQSLALRIPEREREHPTQVQNAIVAMLLVEVNDHLGVAASRKAMTARLELAAQLPEVVDLPVEDELDAAVLARLR